MVWPTLGSRTAKEQNIPTKRRSRHDHPINVYTYAGWAKKLGHRLMTIFLSNLNRFTFFTARFLSKSPPHLKYAATLPCNLALMACFANINVSQGSARCGGTFNMHLTANLQRNLRVKNVNRLKYDRVVVMSLWPRFWPTL